MSHLRIHSVILLLIFALVASPVSSAPGSTLTGTLSTDYFVIHYDPSDPYLARLIAGTATDELMRISKDLGYTPQKGDPFPLSVYRTHLAFIEAGGLKARKFTVGTANSGDQSISVDASGAFVSSQQVLAHEITHAVIFRILGPQAAELPLWLNEGFAEYESDAYDQMDDMLIANAAESGLLIPLSALRTSFPRDNDSLAYAESASAVQYMVKTSGHSSPKVYLEHLARGGSSTAAFEKTTGKVEERFADDWLAKTSRRYAPLRISAIAASLLSVVMALLAIAAFMVRRRQKIEAARRWEWEEFEESMRRQLGNDWHR